MDTDDPRHEAGTHAVYIASTSWSSLAGHTRYVIERMARPKKKSLEGAISGTFWRFKAPFAGLIGAGGARLSAQR
jgi:hypothetical protein